MVATLHRKGLRDLRRRLGQVAAIFVTVALGVLLFVASYDSLRNVQASYDRTYARTHFADLTVTGADPDAIAASVRGVTGVDRVVTRTQADRPMTIGDTKLVGRVVGMPPVNGQQINTVDVVAGRLPRTDASDQVAVESHTADTFGLTTNNITYAVMGEEMNYWKFFPAEEPWARMPVWGISAILSNFVLALFSGEWTSRVLFPLSLC